LTKKPIDKKLGAAIRTHQGRGVSGADACLWVIPGLLIPGCLALYGLAQTVDGYAQNGFSTAGRPWLTAALLLLVPFAILALRRFQAIHTGITIHRNGLHLTGIAGKSVRLTWDEIAGLHTYGTRSQLFGTHLSDRFGLTLTTTGGRTIRVPAHITALVELAEIIRRNTQPRLAPQIEAALERGDPVRFGPITLDRIGLTIDRRTWPWREMDHLRITAGSLVIESGTKRFAHPIADVPNASLLLEFAARFGSGHPGNHET
jgi:hypothetical protein